MSLPQGFHETIQKRVKRQGHLIYDMEFLFARLLVVGQQRVIDLKDVFDHEISPDSNAICPNNVLIDAKHQL